MSRSETRALIPVRDDKGGEKAKHVNTESSKRIYLMIPRGGYYVVY